MQAVGFDVRVVSKVAVAADDTAGYIDVDTGLEWVGAALVEVRRSGVRITSDEVVTLNDAGGAGTVRLADGAATYAVTAADVITVCATGKPS